LGGHGLLQAVGVGTGICGVPEVRVTRGWARVGGSLFGSY
jgi:hypothetical protein